MWLNYEPHDFMFENADDPRYNGPIKNGMKLYIKVCKSNNYLYLSTFSYVNTEKNKNLRKGRFVFKSDTFT